MQKFEDWIERNKHNLCEEANALFSDSLKCLKNNIDRPAFLLAYQGMMVSIRYVLQKGAAPQGFTEGEWTKKITDITNEDIWDSAVFNIVKQEADANKGKAAPLHMPKGIRTQFDYWRSLRNTCAHYKNEPFSKAHVIALYSFIQFYLLNISVSGGLQDMITALQTYCDPTRTPDNEPLIPLLDKTIERLIDIELNEYVREAVKIVVKSPRKDVVTFIESILNLNGAKYAKLKYEIIKYVANKESLMHRLIENDSEKLLLFCTTDERKRQFWNDDLFELRRNRMSVVAFMLNAGWIDDKEKDNFFDSILREIYRYDHSLTINDNNTYQTLVSQGYFERFVFVYLNTKRFNNHPYLGELCYKTNFVISHISQMPLNKKSLEALIEVLGSGRAEPYIVSDRFYKEILAKKEFRDKLTTVASENQIKLPDNWLKTEIKN